MEKRRLLGMLKSTKQFFDTSSAGLTEEDSGFAPQQGMLTAAQQVAHVAQTVDWFLAGAFSEKGMDTEFPRHMQEAMAVTSLQQARDWLDRAFAAVLTKLEETPAEEWTQTIRGDILAGAPRSAIFGGIADHTSHHRGALTVYQRLLGKTPAMPYA